MRVFCSIERPMTATLRPNVSEASKTCWTRAMLEAKVATMTRPSRPFHDVVEGLAARSARRACSRAPRRASSRTSGRARPPRRSGRCPGSRTGLPSTGVWSNLKSPVWMMSPNGRADAQAHGVGDGVADAEGRDVEVAQLDGLARVERLERVVAELVLLDLVAQQAARQGRGVDGHAGELGQHVRQRADVVLVGVGDDEGLDLLARSRAGRRCRG